MLRNKIITAPCENVSILHGLGIKPFSRGAFTFNNMEEIWKDIKGFEGSYQVSNLGKIQSIDRLIWNPANGSYSTQKGRIHKLDFKNKFYAQIGLWKNSKCTKKLVHRLVAESFILNPKNLPEVNHKDTNKLNNCSSNLEWCTRLQNQRDAKNKGLYSNFPKGSAKCNAILNEKAVLHIRRKEMRNIDYCKLYNVKPSTISCLQNDKYKGRWVHCKIQ